MSKKFVSINGCRVRVLAINSRIIVHNSSCPRYRDWVSALPGRDDCLNSLAAEELRSATKCCEQGALKLHEPNIFRWLRALKILFIHFRFCSHARRVCAGYTQYQLAMAAGPAAVKKCGDAAYHRRAKRLRRQTVGSPLVIVWRWISMESGTMNVSRSFSRMKALIFANRV